MTDLLDLVDYRRRVAELYAKARAGGPGKETWLQWCADRDALFAGHGQSPIEDRTGFTSLPYFDYDPSMRVIARLTPDDEHPVDVGHSDEGTTQFLNAGRLQFELGDTAHTLTALWLNTYGGGLFLPFRDNTNGETTYGGGRYLLDTAKGADLGHDGELVTLDFNYAYHPSCVHSPRWSCPLAPPDNHLELEVRAGERLD